MQWLNTEHLTPSLGTASAVVRFYVRTGVFCVYHDNIGFCVCVTCMALGASPERGATSMRLGSPVAVHEDWRLPARSCEDCLSPCLLTPNLGSPLSHGICAGKKRLPRSLAVYLVPICVLRFLGQIIYRSFLLLLYDLDPSGRIYSLSAFFGSRCRVGNPYTTWIT